MAAIKKEGAGLEDERIKHALDIVSSLIAAFLVLLPPPTPKKREGDIARQNTIDATLLTIRPKSNRTEHSTMRPLKRARMLFDESLMHCRDTYTISITMQ